MISDLRPEDLLHKSYLQRLLIEIVDQPLLSRSLAFKGGTCAAMLGYLDRFSVDLDFDILTPRTSHPKLRAAFRPIINRLGFTPVKEFDQILFYQLRYPAPAGKRSTLKVSATDLKVKANEYKVQYFPEIDRSINSQTIETMFANKLVAVTDRFSQHHTVAGRDLYDLHHFFIRGFSYNQAVIQERTGLLPSVYLGNLLTFIKTHATQTLINEDLNSLLPHRQFQQIRKILLPETLSFLENERKKLASSSA